MATDTDVESAVEAITKSNIERNQADRNAGKFPRLIECATFEQLKRYLEADEIEIDLRSLELALLRLLRQSRIRNIAGQGYVTKERQRRVARELSR